MGACCDGLGFFSSVVGDYFLSVGRLIQHTQRPVLGGGRLKAERWQEHQPDACTEQCPPAPQLSAPGLERGP